MLGAPGLINPSLLGFQKPRRVDVLEHQKLKAHFTVKLPGMLHIGIGMRSPSQFTTVFVPARPNIHGAADVDLAVSFAADLVNARGVQSILVLLPCPHRVTSHGSATYTSIIARW
jgi:hypothetical protein